MKKVSIVTLGCKVNQVESEMVAEELDKNGYIVADEKCRTKTPGLFVAGDCRTKTVRQITTATGDGAAAALAACHYLEK